MVTFPAFKVIQKGNERPMSESDTEITKVSSWSSQSSDDYELSFSVCLSRYI